MAVKLPANALIGFYSKYYTESHPGTLKTINGWKWDETVWKDDYTANRDCAPALHDVVINGVEEDRFQSGIGNGLDLQVIEIVEDAINSGIVNEWVPTIRDGHFYFNQEGRWLYSDQSERAYVTNADHDAVNNSNRTTLRITPQDGSPITAAWYSFNSASGEYEIEQQINQVVNFTGSLVGDARLTTTTDYDEIIWANVDRSQFEFLVKVVDSGLTEYTESSIVNSGLTYTIIYNNDYRITRTSEYLGDFDGRDNAIYNTNFSPFVQDADVIISGLTPWTPVYETPVASGEVLVDRDLGRVIFGADSTTKPGVGEKLYITYTHAPEVEYEPFYTTATTVAEKAIVNPILRHNPTGFVVIRAGEQYPVTITLTCDLPFDTEYYGPLYTGGDRATLMATVLDRNQLPIEDQEVTFEILESVYAGSLGTDEREVTTVTDEEGVAEATYTSPTSVEEMGAVSSGLSLDQYTLTFTDLPVLSGSQDRTYLYKVYTDDPVMGIWAQDVDKEYTDFFWQQGIWGTTGQTSSGVEFNHSGTDGVSGDFNTSIDWEIFHRTLNQLLLVAEYSEAARNGRKVIVSEWSDTTQNPHTGALGAYTPVQPVTVSGQQAIFDEHLDIVPNGDLAGYFLAGPTLVTLRAKTYNALTASYIYSNEIQILSEISPYMSGLWKIETANGLLEELPGVIFTTGNIPLGFRIRSDSVTLASALDGVTFLNINCITGTETVTNSGVGVTYIPVSIGQTMGNTGYIVDASLSWIDSDENGSPGWYITDRTTNSFTIVTSGEVPVDGGTAEWAITPVV